MRRATRGPSPRSIGHNNFYPRSPCGERPILGLRPQPPERFLSTLSLRRATIVSTFVGKLIYDFYPRSPCGERPSGFSASIRTKVFLSTLSLRRATSFTPCRAKIGIISIHALLAESDGNGHQGAGQAVLISIHALLAESDSKPRAACRDRAEFLSTLSLRRATTTFLRPYFQNKFLSTLSLRRATPMVVLRQRRRRYFYPRSPCGERPFAGYKSFVTSAFLSTLSLRRATRRCPATGQTASHFYPRSPCGERQENMILDEQIEQISIHALLAESDAHFLMLL